MVSIQSAADSGIALRGKGIGRRISVLVATAVFLAVGLVTAIFAYFDVTGDFNDRKHALEATGYVFASALADHVASQDSQQALLVLRSIGRLPEITYAAVTGKDGQVFASFGSAVIMHGADLKSDLSILAALRGGTYPVAADIIKAGKRIGQIVLIADVSDLRTELRNVLITSLAVAIFAIALALAVAQRLQSRITGPILSLIAAMQSIREARQYQGPVLHHADGETGLLLDSFNAMIEEIRLRDESLERHRESLELTVAQRTMELRLARDAAESANAAKSSFLATMSHEIRTPLNGLMVMAELLAGAGLDQRLQRYAEVIVKSGQSLLTIINDVLDLSKIEAGKLQLESVPVNPANVADDVISLFWEKAASKGLDLAVRVAPGLPETVVADPVRLNQILSNLVNNALKFTETGHVLLSVSYEGGNLVMAVTDSGIGIPHKKLDDLFQAFSQADQTITRKFGGTGLGLAICKRLATAMRGSIGVRSELGKGSTFWVKLPVPAASPPVKQAGPRLHAALAFDGLASQSALGTALAGAGFVPSIAAEATDSADVIFASPDRLKSFCFQPGSRPKVICLSWIGDPDGAEAIQAGTADDLLIMPLRHADVLDMISHIRSATLRGRAAIARPANAPRQLADFSGRHVIVADDNAVNREVIIEVLRQTGVAIEVAVNGREAVNLWLKRRPDLIFMDCSMPDMDGYAATREIRAHETLALAGGRTPIVALTAHLSGTDAEEWRTAGMDAYITKPFTMDQIITCLTSQFAGKPMAVLPQPVQPHGPETTLDPQIIEDLRGIGGSTKLFERVLDLFAGRVPQAVEQVKSLASSSDLKALADATHALKSMCANIGASRAVEACHALEAAARNGTDFDAGNLVGYIVAEVGKVMAEVDRLRHAA